MKKQSNLSVLSFLSEKDDLVHLYNILISYRHLNIMKSHCNVIKN